MSKDPEPEADFATVWLPLLFGCSVSVASGCALGPEPEAVSAVLTWMIMPVVFDLFDAFEV